jgi:hypothetical protein
MSEKGKLEIGKEECKRSVGNFKLDGEFFPHTSVGIVVTICELVLSGWSQCTLQGGRNNRMSYLW